MNDTPPTQLRPAQPPPTPPKRTLLDTEPPEDPRKRLVRLIRIRMAQEEGREAAT